MRNSTGNTNGSRRQKLLNAYRIFATLALVAVVGMLAVLVMRPAPSTAPSVTEIAREINGPAEFQRPSAMEYVAKTDSCVVGGTVTSTAWHVDGKTVGAADVDSNKVDYTEFGFKTDNGQVFTVSENGALYTEPGENLGLELDCNPLTMNSTPSFGMVAIIYGGK